ncbi:MAG: response regulator [Candidatus Paceibacterota bacterium]
MKILVIEDTQKHLQDAKEYVSNLVNCSVHYATTLTEAMELLEKNEYDAVISDVFFPADSESEADTYENALTVSKKLRELDVYHVFNTSLHHHGSGFGNFFSDAKILQDFSLAKIIEVFPDVNSWNEAVNSISLVSYPFTIGVVLESNISGEEVDTKQWEGAFRQVILAIEVRPIILENRFKLSKALKKGRDGKGYEDLNSLVEKYYGGPIKTSFHTIFDYGRTTSNLRDTPDHFQKIFKKYNA